ncbi:MAG TPA: DsbA family oxidoreductase [Trebonia sp.]|jgi:predicted DsbA family dithiol-disulfide isomerase|nr:DsbA family oxidoreductase [Trebonia sp.]
MRVDIWSDVICPWCYVGKTRFEKALESFAHRGEVDVVYHSFELDPSSPRGQRESNLTMLSKKFGKSPAEALALDDQVGRLARAEGLGFDSGRPVGNTFDVHRVLHLGLDRGVQHALLGAVNEAYFAQARDVFDRDVLTEVAAGAGLDAGEVGKVLDGDAYADEVRQDESQARQIGISGVPFFVFDMALGASGAQPAELFASALNQAWDRKS